MSLKTYHLKRHFDRTSEPRGAASVQKKAKGKRSAKPGAALSYVIQKHAASHLHFDFRLELDGVLKSWAVPRGPSRDPVDKRLAVEVEDHPIEYGGFEGTIPAGEYGGGTVMLWDRGTWTPDPGTDPRMTLRAGKLHFTLQGERLRGTWSLVRIRSAKGSSKPQWLLRKSQPAKGEEASRDDAKISDDDRSVVSGRTMDEIAAGKGTAGSRVWSSKTSASPPSKKTPGSARSETEADDGARPPRAVKPAKKRGGAKAARGAVDPSQITGAVKAKMPREVEVQLATLATAAPIGEQWIHEIKFDGYRVIAFVEDGMVRLDSRNGKSLSELFTPVAKALESLGVKNAIVDGECVAVDAKGRTSFQELRRVIKAEISDRSLACYLFDLLYLDGYDLRACTLTDRREALRSLLGGDAKENASIVRFSEAVAGQGEAVLDQACRLALEGIVSKRADAPYSAGRGTAWIKSKCINRQELVIGGFTEPQSTRHGFGALLTGVYDDAGKLVYSGKVGTGFDHATLSDMAKRMKALEVDTPPFVRPPGRTEAPRPHWIKPMLVCEVEFTEWTRDGKLRHPSFMGLRLDKPATEVVREKAVPVSRVSHQASTVSGQQSVGSVQTSAASRQQEHEAADGGSLRGRLSRRVKSGRVEKDRETPTRLKTQRLAHAPTRTSEPASESDVLGIKITHPERVLFAGAMTTKLDLAKYFAAAAQWLLPEVLGRPLSVVRCPGGQRASKCFFQKNWEKGSTIGSHVRTIKLTDSTIDALVIDAPEGLVWLAQNGVLEIHSWGCTEADIEHPDRMVFDLDPSPELAWPRVVEAAVLVRNFLQELGLESVVKTTGGKGLHVIVNLKPRAGWDEVKAFAKQIAETIATQFPDQYIAKMSKAARTGRVFIDYLRNGRGATSIAAYSSRARDGGPVAIPISWEELEALKKRPTYTVNDAMARIRKVENPWAKLPRAKALPSESAR